MKSFVILLVFSFSATVAFAQSSPTLALATVPAEVTPTTAAAAPAAPAVTFRMLPALPNKVDFKAYLAEYVTYPEVAAENNIEGTVVVELDVAADGKVLARRVVRSAHELLDAAAVSGLENLKSMLPAVIDGTPVARTLTVPVRFSLY